MIVRVFVIWILMLGLVKAQVPLPYITSFGLADQPNIRQLWAGPWDQVLRCDGLDSLSFGPSCCTQGQFVPWMGLTPVNYGCQHLASSVGGHYLRMVKEYSLSGTTLAVWPQPVLFTPRIPSGTLPVLSIRAAKNTMHMFHATTPWSAYSFHGNAFAYAALEVSLVDSAGGSAIILDTLVLNNSWTLYHVDAGYSLQQSPTSSRIRLRMLGDGDVAIDWVRIEATPSLTWTTTPACSSTSPNGSISVNPIPGFIPPITWIWNTGAIGSSIIGLTSGTYTVEATDSTGQFTRRQIHVPSSVNLTLDSVHYVGPQPGVAWLTAQGSGSISWYWTGPNNFQSSVPNPLLSQPGWYTVVATDTLGCSATLPVFIGLNCAAIPSPSAFLDSTCVGTPYVPPIASPPTSAHVVRFWTTSTDTALNLALPPVNAFSTSVSGWVLRYARWLDTVQACVGPPTLCSLWVGSMPLVPTPYTWTRCPQNTGFVYPWALTQSTSKLQWRTPSVGVWTWGTPPDLTPIETNLPSAIYPLLTRYVDTLGGCESAATLSSYQVKTTYQAGLSGPSLYHYGQLHQVQRLNSPPGVRYWTVNYGGRFEVINNQVHPCHNATACLTNDPSLFVRGSVVPCWNTPTVTVTVSQSATGIVCDSLSNLTSSHSGTYECFSTSINQIQPIGWAAPGDSLMLDVSTVPNVNNLPGNPLSMSYATCSYTIPHRWEVRPPSGTWTPLDQVIPANSFTTQTGTDRIRLVVASAPTALHGYDVRLALERCQGNWSYSASGTLHISLDLIELDTHNDLIFGPNPSSGWVRFRTSSGGTEQHISLVDPSGRIIRQFAVGEEGYELQLPPGIFFVHTTNGTRRKLVVF